MPPLALLSNFHQYQLTRGRACAISYRNQNVKSAVARATRKYHEPALCLHRERKLMAEVSLDVVNE